MQVVDLFAGAGGFSEGARQAGCELVWAANHWQDAVDIHQLNHSKAIHACQDLKQADFTKLPSYDVLLASPSCQGHSRARGVDKPHHDESRSTAWSVVSCVEATRPKAFVVENVQEFTEWILFSSWKQCLEKLGYTVTINTLNAQDFGVPQSRLRVFVTGVLSRKPFCVSVPNPFAPPVSFSSIMENFSATKGWSSVLTKAQSTVKQWKQGRKVHGDKFLIAYYGNERQGRSIHKPLGTVTTKERFCLVHKDQMRLLTLNEYRKAMGFPEHYQLPASKAKAVHMLGNAVCPPVACEVLLQLQKFF